MRIFLSVLGALPLIHPSFIDLDRYQHPSPSPHPALTTPDSTQNTPRRRTPSIHKAPGLKNCHHATRTPHPLCCSPTVATTAYSQGLSTPMARNNQQQSVHLERERRAQTRSNIQQQTYLSTIPQSHSIFHPHKESLRGWMDGWPSNPTKNPPTGAPPWDRDTDTTAAGWGAFLMLCLSSFENAFVWEFPKAF